MMNVAVAMENVEAREQAQEILTKIQANPAVNALLEDAETVEDMYEVAKRYIDMNREEFRNAFEAAINYYNNTKQELDDDTMECIVGGSWSWSTVKKIALGVAIAVGVAAACAVTAGAAGAAVGAFGALVAGTSVATGATAGAATGALTGCILGTYNVGKELLKE